MSVMWKKAILSQFIASIDMFDQAMRDCPDELWRLSMWSDPKAPPEFSAVWYVIYHTLFWLDLYLHGSVDGFTPPAPYTLDELKAGGVLPERVYTRQELLTYLDHCRRKCIRTIDSSTDLELQRMCYFPWNKQGLPFAELLMDNMRHVQEHGAQLRMFMGQQQGISSRWMGQMKDDNPLLNPLRDE